MIMKKRIFCFMLTLALLISIVPAQSAFAASKITAKAINKAPLSEVSSEKQAMLSKKGFKSPKKGQIVFYSYDSMGVWSNVQVQIAKDKKFKKSVKNYLQTDRSKKFTCVSNSKATEMNDTLKCTIKGLKKGTYYVRMRNYTHTGTGIVESRTKWSKTYKVKVK